jgi:prepilin-type processing-associated H-X9-DG protein
VFAAQLNPVQRAAAGTVVPLLLCPSDGQNPRFVVRGDTYAGTNYLVSIGSGTSTHYDPRYPTDGYAWYDSKVKPAEVTDGTSNTVMFAETLLGIGQDASGPPPEPLGRFMASYGSVWTPRSGGPGVTQGGAVVTDPDLASHLGAVTSWSGFRGSAWIRGLEYTTTANGFLTPNHRVPDFTAHGRTFSAARSNHAGGVNVAFGDGSVRFVRDSVPVGTWRALFSRSGGEVVGDF